MQQLQNCKHCRNSRNCRNAELQKCRNHNNCRNSRICRNCRNCVKLQKRRNYRNCGNSRYCRNAELQKRRNCKTRRFRTGVAEGRRRSAAQGRNVGGPAWKSSSRGRHPSWSWFARILLAAKLFFMRSLFCWSM